MIALTLAEIATAVGGTVDAGAADLIVDAEATLDSREVRPGGLFVAVRGTRVDGHDYAVRAVGAGAAAVLAQRPVGVPAVIVDDVVTALGRLARAVLERLDVTLVAVTGSQGKTSVKDYLTDILSAAGPSVATRANHNNELGVPLTVLRADTTTRYLIVEMGARGIGHIAYLCDIAPPRIAGVLNVGTAHIGEFGSVDNIAIAKGEIVEALGADGRAVLNADDARVAAMATRTQAPVLTFGESGQVAWRDLRLDPLGRPSAEIGYAGRWHPLQLSTSGAHQIANAAAAAAFAIGAGLDLADIVEALGAARPRSPWRMEVTQRVDGLVVVNDAYNANPASMRSALDTLATMGRTRDGRTVAVLGEMLELGDDARTEHEHLGAFAVDRGIDVILAVGTAGEWIHAGALAHAAATGRPVESFVTPTRADASRWLGENVSAHDVVLVKASRGGALEVVADDLLTQEGGPTT